jgi:hypothetical protein
VACAAFLESRNKERSFWSMLLNLRTHFKERKAIKEMRALAGKCSSILSLMHEAENEGHELKTLRKDVAEALLIEKDIRKPLFDKKTVAEIEQGAEELLDESMDLEEAYFERIADDDAAGKDLFGDESMLESVQTIERVEFDEDDIDIFPKSVEERKVEIRESVKDKNISK